jgi:hypothetical protein
MAGGATTKTTTGTDTPPLEKLSRLPAELAQGLIVLLAFGRLRPSIF